MENKQKISDRVLSSRYIAAIENETERTRLYNELIAAQLNHRNALRVLEETEYALKIAQNNIDDFEGE